MQPVPPSPLPGICNDPTSPLLPSQGPNGQPHDRTHDPKPGILHHRPRRTPRRTCRRPVGPIVHRAVDEQRLRAIHSPHPHQCRIHIRITSIADQIVNVRRIVIVIAPTGAILATETLDGERSVLLRGSVVEVVGVAVGISVGAVEPEAGEEAQRRSAEEVGCYAAGRPTTGAVGGGGAATVVSTAAEGWGPGCTGGSEKKRYRVCG